MNKLEEEKNKYKHVFIRDEQVVIEGCTYLAKEAFFFEGEHYLLVSDGKYNFHSLYNVTKLTSPKLVIKNFMNVGEVVKEFTNACPIKRRAINESMQINRGKAEALRAMSYDPRKKLVDTIKEERSRVVGDLLKLNVDAPYATGNKVLIDAEGIKALEVKVDSHLKLALHKYLIVTDLSYNISSIYRFTGKKSREVELLVSGLLSIEASIQELARLSQQPVSEVRASRLSGMAQSNKPINKFKL